MGFFFLFSETAVLFSDEEQPEFQMFTDDELKSINAEALQREIAFLAGMDSIKLFFS